MIVSHFSITLLICLLGVTLATWAFERFYLRGGKIKDFPVPEKAGVVSHYGSANGLGPEFAQVTEKVRELAAQTSIMMRRATLLRARANLDTINDGRDYGTRFVAVDAGAVAAEWVLAPGAQNDRRVLYIHGGGFIMGSARSHRSITSKFAKITGCAILAINYRLLPENRFEDCLADCRNAYRWILQHGPDCEGASRQLFLGGDSAGASLVLSTMAWARDNNIRAADAVVALSPVTDATFSGASVRSNAASDTMLAPTLHILNALPQFVKSWMVLASYRMRPANPAVSPLRGDLAGLPPTLVQASEAEMLLDDARRYVYKAYASGSPVKLQTWSDMLHVWQFFAPQLPQAEEAWVEIGKFLSAQPAYFTSIPDAGAGQMRLHTGLD